MSNNPAHPQITGPVIHYTSKPDIFLQTELLLKAMEKMEPTGSSQHDSGQHGQCNVYEMAMPDAIENDGVGPSVAAVFQEAACRADPSSQLHYEPPKLTLTFDSKYPSPPTENVARHMLTVKRLLQNAVEQDRFGNYILKQDPGFHKVRVSEMVQYLAEKNFQPKTYYRLPGKMHVFTDSHGIRHTGPVDAGIYAECVHTMPEKEIPQLLNYPLIHHVQIPPDKVATVLQNLDIVSPGKDRTN